MKRGFTLVELLAVIVILAIIALIATPIILNIINDTKKESLVRSAENYLTAVKQQIAVENIKKEYGPKVCTGSGLNLVCEMNDGSIQELNLKLDGKLPDDVVISFENGEIKKDSNTQITYGEKTISYKEGKLKEIKGGEGGNPEEKEQEEDPTKYTCIKKETATLGNVPEGNYAPGDEYTCTVNNGTSYTFFVLSTFNDNVNLIMEENSEFSSTWGYKNDDGPVDLMSALHDFTSDWDMINSVSFGYRDTETTGSHMSDTGAKAGYQYLSIYSGGVKITNYYGSEKSYAYTLKGRAITKEEATRVGCTATVNSCPAWINNTWTVSSNSTDSFSVYQVNNNRLSSTATPMIGYKFRPVITVPKTSIKN